MLIVSGMIARIQKRENYRGAKHFPQRPHFKKMLAVFLSQGGMSLTGNILIIPGQRECW
jgi:hypothetical protein